MLDLLMGESSGVGDEGFCGGIMGLVCMCGSPMGIFKASVPELGVCDETVCRSSFWGLRDY